MAQLCDDQFMEYIIGGITMFYSTIYHSPIGELTLACDDNGHLVGLWMKEQKYFGASLADEILAKDDCEIFIKTKDWLDRYFKGLRPSISELSLKPIGSQFRQDVWQILCEIPYGELTSYGSIAKKMAERSDKASMSAQAVGGAVGHNPISIIIPCHRVVGTDGSLTGYAGGIDRKIKLLEHEGIDLAKLWVPHKGTTL